MRGAAGIESTGASGGSVWDPVRRVVDQAAADDVDARDPAFLTELAPLIGAALRWFDPEVDGFEHLPDAGPFLIVGNHSGGIYMPDHWAFLHRWLQERGPEAPLYSLAFDLLFALPGAADAVRRLGAVPASPEHADRLLEQGHPVLVYPGGDAEDYRRWTERHRVDLRGHDGFVRLALRHGVPVVPLVSHGSHDAIIVLARGDGLARRLHLDRLRINVLPLLLGPPFGVAPVQVPTVPLPAKVTVRVGEPLCWPDLDTDAADDPATVHRCYEEVRAAMQDHLDDLVAAHPHPVAHRVGTALGLDRLRHRS